LKSALNAEEEKTMANGRYILNDLEFKNKIAEMNDRALMEFTAELAYSSAIRVTSLENQSKKSFGVTGGVSAFFGAAIAATVDYFMRRGS
jgi:hypothetical protein